MCPLPVEMKKTIDEINMGTITHTQVQELVKQLPTTKLPRAYSMLLELAEKEADTLSPQLDFMKLSMPERRKIMAQQAEQMAAHYKQTAVEREEWQSGDFIDVLFLACPVFAGMPGNHNIPIHQTYKCGLHHMECICR
jgi:hypothetical protein